MPVAADGRLSTGNRHGTATAPLQIVPITFAEASAFVAQHHRTHKPSLSAKFCVAVAFGEEIVGVAVCGRPVARSLDDGWTLEVTRTCTDGTKNVNSMLYGACARAAKALGYRRIGTYTLKDEPGTSLKAAGWRITWELKGRSWDCQSRPRVDKHPTQDKIRWELDLCPEAAR